jgi:hypothetical protein
MGLGATWRLNWLGSAEPICRLGRMPSTSPPGCVSRRATKSPAARCYPREPDDLAAGSRPYCGVAAVAVGRTEIALGAFYRRLYARVGKAKAVTATARKIAVLLYNTLRHVMEYSDP